MRVGDRTSGQIHSKPISRPPIGKCKVVNMYVDPKTGKLIIEYDNVPRGGDTDGNS